MDQQQRFRTGERINNISTNTFQIWETTVRLARIRTLMDHLCAANDENDELIYCLREPNEPIEDTPEDASSTGKRNIENDSIGCSFSSKKHGFTNLIKTYEVTSCGLEV